MKLNKYQRMEVLATPAAYRILVDTVRINRAMYADFEGEDQRTFAGRLAVAALKHFSADGYMIFVAGPLVVRLVQKSVALDGTIIFEEIRIRLLHEAGQDLDQQAFCYVTCISGDWEEWA